MRPTPMTKLLLFTVSALALFMTSCPKDKEDCTTCPPPVTGDTLITFERVLADGEQPAVSPDGKKIAYTCNGDIFVMDTSVQTTMWWDGQNWRYDTTGGKITQLTNGSAIDILPRWSPDGQTVGFVRLQSYLDDDGNIYTVTLNGGSLTEIPLTYLFSNYLKRVNEKIGGTGIPMLDISPDGKYLAYLSKENDSVYINVVDYPVGLLRVHKTMVRFPNDGFPSFAWSQNSGEIAFIVGEKDAIGRLASRALLFNFGNNKTVCDSLSYEGLYINRAPLSNIFLFRVVDSGKYVIRITNFKDQSKKTNIPFIAALKLSPDENLLLYHQTGQVYGPFGYEYSQIGIYDLRNKRQYFLSKYSDVNRVNYYFEWGRASNIVFFERYKKIVKSTFILPQ